MGRTGDYKFKEKYRARFEDDAVVGDVEVAEALTTSIRVSVMRPERRPPGKEESWEITWERRKVPPGAAFEQDTVVQGDSVKLLIQKVWELRFLYWAIVILVIVQLCMVIAAYAQQLQDLAVCPVRIDDRGKMRIFHVFDFFDVGH